MINVKSKTRIYPLNESVDVEGKNLSEKQEKSHEFQTLVGMDLKIEDLIIWAPETKSFGHFAPKKAILKGINAHFRPSTMTAIIGPSGCGKTTFLNFLAGRQESSQNFRTYCSLYLNDFQMNQVDDFKNIIGYVTQEDILETRMTPKKLFRFYSKLRGVKNVKAAIEKVISAMHLENCADTPIGNPTVRGLSGGERKRTSIGVELVSNPKLLFLDEPTTGLDSGTALQVMQNISELKEKGLTIAATIHQPSEEIMKLFDTIILMVDGSIVYKGPPNELESRLHQLDLKIFRFETPIETFMKSVSKHDIRMRLFQNNLPNDDCYVDTVYDSRIDQLTQIQNQIDKAEYKSPDSSQKDMPEFLRNTSEINKPISFFNQFWLVFCFHSYLFFTSPNGIVMRFTMILGVLFFLTIVFINTPSPEENSIVNIQNFAGLIFLININHFFGGTGTAASLIIAYKDVFKRDNHARMYSRLAFFSAISASIIPFYFVSITAVGVAYFFIFKMNFDHISNLVWFLLYLNLSNIAGTSVGMVVSALAERFDDLGSLSPLITMPLIFVSGFFADVEHMTWPLKIFSYIAPTRFLIQGSVLNIFSNKSRYLVNCFIGLPCFDNPNVECRYHPPNGTDLAKNCDPIARFNPEFNSIWNNYFIALGLTMAWRILAFFIFITKYRDRRIDYSIDDELCSQYVGLVNGKVMKIQSFKSDQKKDLNLSQTPLKLNVNDNISQSIIINRPDD